MAPQNPWFRLMSVLDSRRVKSHQVVGWPRFLGCVIKPFDDTSSGPAADVIDDDGPSDDQTTRVRRGVDDNPSGSSPFAATAPSAADFAKEFRRTDHAAVVETLTAFAQGEPGDLVSVSEKYGRCFQPRRAMACCGQLLDAIEAARVALGHNPLKWIPRIRPRRVCCSIASTWRRRRTTTTCR